MAKVNPKDLKRIKELGIDTTKITEESQARKALTKFLAKNEVEVTDDEETISELLDMAEVFADEEVEEEDEEFEDDDNAEEEDEEDETEEEDEEYEDDEEEEEEQPRKPVKKSTPAKKPAPPAKKKPVVVEEEDEDEEDEEYEEEDEDDEETAELVEEVKAIDESRKKSKPAAKPAAKKVVNGSTVFDARNIPEHEALLEPFKEIFDSKKFQFDILKQGFTVRAIGPNSKVPVMNYDSLKIDADGELKGDFYNNTFKSPDELMELLPESLGKGKNEKFFILSTEKEKDQDVNEIYEVGMFRGESHPCIKRIGQSEVIELLENYLLDTIKSKVGLTDKKMADNRKKLEDSLAKKKPVVKKK